MPVPSNESWLKGVLSLGDNKVLLPQLIGQFTESSAIPFVGAGLSAPYNLPQWAELVKGLAPDVEIETQVKALLVENDYEGAAELLMNVKGPRRFQLLFREKFDSVAIDLTKKTAVPLLARLRRGPIITTNFDRVLESVLEHEGCSLKVIAGEKPEEIGTVLDRQRDALLKFHGDIEDPASRVLTKSEYDKAYSGWLTTVLSNMATRCMLFLGCSLKTDRPMEVLAEMVRQGHAQVHHYAFLSLPKTVKETRERSMELSEKYHIDAIWYPTGEHENVAKLLEYVVDQVRPDFPRNRKGPIYRNLPEGRATLFGRNSDELVKLIESSRIVAVEGGRGVGKTSFALQALHRFRERTRFGALGWITASARKDKLQLSHVLDAISLAIDFPFKALTPPSEKEAQLAEELKRRRTPCLLLFDNYETVTDPEIEGFLFDPQRFPSQLHVLITIFGRLERAGVVRYPLYPLDSADAIAMFRDRLTNNRLKQESDENATRLCQTVEGNPLAIELIVGLLQTGVPLQDVLDHVEKNKGSILQRVFEESWNLLDARQRETLQALSIFVRPALAEAVQAASNLDKVGFEETLEVLTRLYLVKRLTMHEEQESLLTGRRYFLHPYIRDVLETLRREGEEATFYKRLASSYVSYIRERGGTPEKEDAADVDQLNGELDNILGVLDGCWKVGEQMLVIPVAEAMARWLFTESHWDHLEKYGARAADGARKMGEPHAAARILSEIGRTYSYRLDFDRASKIFAEAMTLARRNQKDDWAIAYIQHHMGESLMRRKDYPRAKAILQTSLKGFTNIESRRSMIGVRYRLAMLAFETNRLKEAKKLATQGVEDSIREGWERLEGFNCRLLGDIAVRQGQFDEARSCYRQALKTVPRRDMRIQALIELSLARLEDESGNKELALEKAAIALAHFRKLRMPREIEDARRLAEGLPAAPAQRRATRRTPTRRQRSARPKKS